MGNSSLKKPQLLGCVCAHMLASERKKEGEDESWVKKRKSFI